MATKELPPEFRYTAFGNIRDICQVCQVKKNAFKLRVRKPDKVELVMCHECFATTIVPEFLKPELVEVPDPVEPDVDTTTNGAEDDLEPFESGPEPQEPEAETPEEEPDEPAEEEPEPEEPEEPTEDDSKVSLF